MAAQANASGVGSYRLIRLAVDGFQALLWLVALAVFLRRPYLNHQTPYSRLARAGGLAVLGFALAYGAAAVRFGVGYSIYAAFVVAGFVIARVASGARRTMEIGGGLILTGLGFWVHGAGFAVADAVNVLLPLALAEAAGFSVERIWKEDELSIQDLRNRNVELEELAYRDPLTRLYNRRFGFETLRKSISLARRHGADLQIMVLDIDHFKKVNDELGHPVGDTVLVRLAKVLEGSVRESDVISRIGGEEFLIILPLSRAEHVQSVANRIRDNTAGVRFESVPWRVTVSIGVTGLRDDDTVESIFSRADRFLYDSKRGGRNRVTGS